MNPILPTLLASLALSACAAASTSAPVATAAVDAPAASAAVAQAPVAAPAPAAAPAAASGVDLAAGQKAFEQGCFSCHDQATILSNGGRSKAEWEEVVTMMQDRGFSGSPQEIRLIVDYLAATHPPKV